MRLAGALVAMMAIAGCGSGCGRDGGAVPMPAAVLPGVADRPVDPASAPEVAEPDRDLWFADGPGRAAILARERGDHAAALAHLEALLARTDLSQGDRAAAELLAGMEDLHRKRYAAAADRFAAAAKAEALQALSVRLAVLEAQARLDAGQPEIARERIAAIDAQALSDSPLADDAAILEADARLRTDDRAGAIAIYRKHLREHPRGDRRYEARAKLARALASSETPSELAEAVTQYEDLVLAVPLSEYGEEAARELPDLRRRAGVERTGEDARQFDRRRKLAQADAMLSRSRYAQAIRLADDLLGKKGLPAAQGCEALYIKGSAIFKQRKRAAARPVFEKADRSCAKAGSGEGGRFVDMRVKSRYQAARGLYAEGKHAVAAAAFEAIARDHADHSYVDDAWILAGESWQEHGDAKAARKAYEHAAAGSGDMRDEARRRLLVMLASAGEHDPALALCDRALAEKPADPQMAAKLHYFRGRALAALSRPDDATAAWREALSLAPLDYPGLMAWSRLHEAGDEAKDAAIAILSRAPKDAPPIEIPKTDGARRAVMLARLGLGTLAREELSHAQVDGWPAVLVLNQAGLFSEAQRTIANLGIAWRSAPPDNSTRARWEAAHPRPFADIIEPGERTHGVPPLLTFAIMQTESRFDPGVTSWAGAKGLVQLMPATAKGLAREAGVALDDDGKLHDPAINLDLGMRYLGRLAARFGGDDGAVALAAASYNAGAGNVDKWLADRGGWDLDLFIESIPFDETRKYTQSVLGRWHAYRWLYGPGDPAERAPRLPVATPSRAP